LSFGFAACGEHRKGRQRECRSESCEVLSTHGV
jgi:hypothetical protein